jgi:hypothetical protein
MIRPTRKDLNIIRRSDFDYSFVVYETFGGDRVNWQDVEVLAQLWDRKREVSYGAFNVNDSDLSLGLVIIKLDADDTINLPKTAVYDIKVLFPDGNEYYIVTGSFTVSEGYTDD